MTGRMLVKLLLLLMLSEVLLFSVSEGWPPSCDSSYPSGTQWYNSWQNSFSVKCPDGSSFYQWKSIHRNCKQDRIHHFKCAYGFCDVSSCTCAWSLYYENAFDQPLTFTCPDNGVIAGVVSDYSGMHGDRRFGFRCCHSYGYKAHTCSSTPYENVWGGDLDYKVEHGKYLVGVYSYHDDNHGDRRWSFLYCKVSKC